MRMNGPKAPHNSLPPAGADRHTAHHAPKKQYKTEAEARKNARGAQNANEREKINFLEAQR